MCGYDIKLRDVHFWWCSCVDWTVPWASNRVRSCVHVCGWCVRSISSTPVADSHCSYVGIFACGDRKSIAYGAKNKILPLVNAHMSDRHSLRHSNSVIEGKVWGSSRCQARYKWVSGFLRSHCTMRRTEPTYAFSKASHQNVKVSTISFLPWILERFQLCIIVRSGFQKYSLKSVMKWQNFI